MTTEQTLFYKVGVKIFNDSGDDNTEELANGISIYKTLVVPNHASSLSTYVAGITALTLISLF